MFVKCIKNILFQTLKDANKYTIIIPAMRFALMEAKVALAKMVLATDMKVAPGHEEMELSTGPGILRPAKGVELILTPLKGE